MYYNGDREGMVMRNFMYHNPVTLFFGRGQAEQLRKEVPKYGKKCCLFTVEEA